MSLSPQLVPDSTITSPPIKSIPSPSTANTPPSSLAALLAESYQEVESLRRELAVVRKRAEKAERLASSLQALQSAISPTSATSESTPNGTATTNPPTPFPESATRILMDFEDRAVRAEVARDESEARKRVLMDTWTQLESYLAAMSEAAADARAGYGRIVLEGGGQLVLGQIPTLPGAAMPPPAIRHRVPSGRAGVLGTPVFPSMSLPPHSHPTPGTTAAGSRRPRSPSMDGYHQPPSKKSRGDDRSGYLGDAPHNSPYAHPPPSHEYHYPDPHAPQHTYPPPPPPPQHQRVVYRGHSQPHHGHPPPPHHPHAPQPQARMILPPHQQQHHSRSRHRRTSPSPHRNSRSRSSSSDTSMSVDEMLLQATGTGDENGVVLAPPGMNGNLDHQQHMVIPRQRSSRRSEREQHQPQHMYSQPGHPHHGVDPHAQPHLHSQQYSHPPLSRPPSYRKVGGSVGPEGNGSGSGEFQTHIFAPPVTGAPTKKSKFAEPPVPPPHLAGQQAAGVPFPPVNDQGQRICRQCGVAGRYKEGKCVEKWGPGPLGPGTVCDRCRKKMKRVERRGTMDTQQLPGSTATTILPQTSPHHSLSSHRSQTQSRSVVHRTDTIPAQQSPYGSSVKDPKADVTYSTPPPPPKSMRPPASPPPTIAALNEDDIPTSEIGRGSEAAAAALKSNSALAASHSRSSSRNGHVSGGSSKGGSKGGKLTPTSAGAAAEVNGNGNGTASKKSPLQAGTSGSGRTSKSPLAMDVDKTVEVDAEAEADADAEAEVEAEIEAELEGAVEEVVGKRVGADALTEVDAEADLLEAVDAAAEANSAKGDEDGSGT